MKHNRLKVLLALTGALALIAVAIFVLADRSSVKHRFPMWREVNEQESSFAVNTDVSLELEGIDFSAYSQGEDAADTVHVAARCSVHDAACGVNYRVDYLAEEKWYTVYESSRIHKAPLQILKAGDNHLQYTVPAGLFHHKGQYRLYIDSLGFCEIDMLADIQ